MRGLSWTRLMQITITVTIMIPRCLRQLVTRWPVSLADDWAMLHSPRFILLWFFLIVSLYAQHISHERFIFNADTPDVYWARKFHLRCENYFYPPLHVLIIIVRVVNVLSIIIILSLYLHIILFSLTLTLNPLYYTLLL